MRNSFHNEHHVSKIVFSLFIILVSFLFTFIIGLLIAIPFFDIGFSELSTALSDYNNPNNVNFLKYLQCIQAIGLFIIPAFIIAYLYSENPLNYLGFKISFPVNSAILTIFIFLVAIPIISYLGIINAEMQLPPWMSGIENWMKNAEESAKIATHAFLKMDNIFALLFSLFMIGILPAVGEELIFRGIFQKIIGNWAKNIHLGIIISAFLFSAMHFQFYGFLPRFVLGVLLGYLFFWSRSIWIPILGHFINNSAAIIIYYVNRDKSFDDIESIGSEFVPFLGISIAIFIILLWAFYKESKTAT